MNTDLLHIYRNTSMGRESYLQSLYFCKMMDIGLSVYIPERTNFCMNLDHKEIRINLDKSYLTSPESAVDRVKALAQSNEVDVTMISSKPSTHNGVPGVQNGFSFMTCPRSISDLSSKIRLGFIGAKVRQIVNRARFSVLITCPVFKPWKSLTVLFGGSDISINALRLGIRMARHTGLPLNMLTFMEEELAYYEHTLKTGELAEDVEQSVDCWHQFENGHFEDHLYAVPHDSLVIVGAYGHGRMKNLLFGSKLEKIQATLSNSLLIAGPRVRIPHLPHHDLEAECIPEIVATVPSFEPASVGGHI